MYIFHLEKNRHFFLRNSNKKPKTPLENKKISVVIAARNEANNLTNLLEALRLQDYPSAMYEVFVVDDNSNDNSLSILNAYQTKHPSFQLQILAMKKSSECISPKQEALIKGINKASGSIIATTDADCIMSENWLSTINTYFNDQKCMLLLGTVLFHKEESLFEKFQSLEFLSIMGMTAGATYQQKATMCNGANLAYRKTLFESQNTYNESLLASGDDVFLLFKVKKTYPDGIVFSAKHEHLVYTRALSKGKDFIQQRKRWASKTRVYKDFDALYSGGITMLGNLFYVVLSFLCFIDSYYLLLFLVFAFLKAVADYRITYVLAKHFKKKSLLRYFIPEFLIYAYYVILVALLSLQKNYYWKGRKLQ